MSNDAPHDKRQDPTWDPSFWRLWRDVGLGYAVDEYVNHHILNRLGLFSKRFCEWVDRKVLE